MAAPVAAGTVRALQCPNCGGAVAIRGMAHTLTVVCERCASVLDATDPGLRVIQRFDERMKVRPRIPLGTRGTWRGAPHEVIGFQQRTIIVDGVRYSWYEYLLFNPYHGFRYLTEYHGHWNDVVPARALPNVDLSARPVATLGGTAFRHFQHASAETTFALGEFPWQARVGDTADVDDFVAPPRILSREQTPGETTWSVGSYVSGKEVWRAFGLPGDPPTPGGVYANQPSPWAQRARGLFGVFHILFLILAVVFAVTMVAARREQVFTGDFSYVPWKRGAEGAFVTEPFELRGHTSNVEVTTETNLDDSWLYLSLALIGEGTGTAYEIGREVSYYSGIDGGERWSEGNRRDRALIPSVPSGRYYLRVEPDGPTDSREIVGYRLTLRRDVPPVSYFLVTLLLLLVPPLWAFLRNASFEAERWRESDYAPSSGDDE